MGVKGFLYHVVYDIVRHTHTNYWLLGKNSERCHFFHIRNEEDLERLRTRKSAVPRGEGRGTRKGMVDASHSLHCLSGHIQAKNGVHSFICCRISSTYTAIDILTHTDRHAHFPAAIFISPAYSIVPRRCFPCSVLYLQRIKRWLFSLSEKYIRPRWQKLHEPSCLEKKHLIDIS